MKRRMSRRIRTGTGEEIRGRRMRRSRTKAV